MEQFADIRVWVRWFHVVAATGWVGVIISSLALAPLMGVEGAGRIAGRLRMLAGAGLLFVVATGLVCMVNSEWFVKSRDLFFSPYGALLLLKGLIAGGLGVIWLAPTAARSDAPPPIFASPPITRIVLGVCAFLIYVGMLMRRL